MLRGKTQEKIRRKMIEHLEAEEVAIVDESWKHAGHAGAESGGGHFILRVVSKRFGGVSRLDRNRLVFQTLAQEMQGEIHALSVAALTPEERAKDAR